MVAFIILTRIAIFLCLVGIVYLLVTKITNANKTDLDKRQDELNDLEHEVDQASEILRRERVIEKKIDNLNKGKV